MGVVKGGSDYPQGHGQEPMATLHRSVEHRSTLYGDGKKVFPGDLRVILDEGVDIVKKADSGQVVVVRGKDFHHIGPFLRPMREQELLPLFIPPVDNDLDQCRGSKLQFQLGRFQPGSPIPLIIHIVGVADYGLFHAYSKTE